MTGNTSVASSLELNELEALTGGNGSGNAKDDKA